MKKSTLLFIVATAGFFSCGQDSGSTPATIDKKTLPSTENVQRQTPSTNYDDRYIDTRYAYRDSLGMRLTIHNSLPKGGLQYTDATSKTYVYAIFWTRISNETSRPFELAIHFPEDSYELPSSPGNHFKLLFPSYPMTPDKASLFNYGLTDLKSFLDNAIHKTSSLKRTIPPKDSSSFYVVTLFERGLGGTLRTGLSLKEKDLFYRINDREIHCGTIDSKFVLQQ